MVRREDVLADEALGVAVPVRIAMTMCIVAVIVMAMQRVGGCGHRTHEQLPGASDLPHRRPHEYSERIKSNLDHCAGASLTPS
jgi:hypothetical protein